MTDNKNHFPYVTLLIVFFLSSFCFLKRDSFGQEATQTRQPNHKKKVQSVKEQNKLIIKELIRGIFWKKKVKKCKNIKIQRSRNFTCIMKPLKFKDEDIKVEQEFKNNELVEYKELYSNLNEGFHLNNRPGSKRLELFFANEMFLKIYFNDHLMAKDINLNLASLKVNLINSKADDSKSNESRAVRLESAVHRIQSLLAQQCDIQWKKSCKIRSEIDRSGVIELIRNYSD